MNVLADTKSPNPEDTDMVNNETEKISMTLTTNSIEWLENTYPDAQSTQEAVRMAISDARQHHIGMDNVRMSEDGKKAVLDLDQSSE